MKLTHFTLENHKNQPKAWLLLLKFDGVECSFVIKNDRDRDGIRSFLILHLGDQLKKLSLLDNKLFLDFGRLETIILVTESSGRFELISSNCEGA